MPKPKRLSGREVISVLQRFGFEIANQRGSHVRLQRAVAGEKQKLTIPDHKELDIGTVVGIFRQASRFVPEDELRKHFYSS